MLLRKRHSRLLLDAFYGFATLENSEIALGLLFQKPLKHFISFLDVVTPNAVCRGSSAWESARLKTESSHVQTLPSAPNNLNLRLFCNIGHKLQHYLRSARKVMRYERRNVSAHRLCRKSKIMVEANNTA